jgi:hypothetical protein
VFAGAESQGAEIKLPPGARAEITIAALTPAPAPALTDLKRNFKGKKSWFLKRFLWIITILILLL